MEKILKNDLVIPKGTIFTEIPYHSTTKYGNGNFEATIGLTKNTSGSIVYSFDDGANPREKKKLNEYFGNV